MDKVEELFELARKLQANPNDNALKKKYADLVKQKFEYPLS